MTSAAEWWRQHQVTVPEGESGNWRIERFSVAEIDLKLYNLRLAFNSGQGGRLMVPGEYTRLMRGRELVMSDTRAEIRDHATVIHQISQAKTVMIAGLGLGMVLNAALTSPSVEAVKVFEISGDVIDLTEEHYRQIAQKNGKLLIIFVNDIFDVKPYSDNSEHFDVVWFDIWDHISADNWEGMKKLKRTWRRHAEWMGCWCESECRYQATGRHR